MSKPKSTYQALIASILQDPSINPRHVEAWMRDERPTLDGLSPRRFETEARRAAEAAKFAGPALSETLALFVGV